jgi:hypothetical protein
MRAVCWTALVIVAGLLSADARAAESKSPPAGGRVDAVAAMKAPLKELGAFLSNGSFKLKQGVAGVGSRQGRAFSIQDCCSINMERMRAALDAIARERSDLQREYERTRHAEGIAKLDALSVSLKTFEEGYRLLLAAQRPHQAMAVFDGLLKSLQGMESAHSDLSLCCSPAER